MKLTAVIALNTFLLITACNEKENLVHQPYSPAVIETTGYQVPVDSLVSPVITPLDESTLLISRVGEPKSFATNTNIFRAGKPEIKIGTIPNLITPGKDTFLLPEMIKVIDSAFLAGTPEINRAKDAYTKDQNPQNFSTFNKLQGLKHGNIRCLLEDHLGNIWLGTEGGGVSKYDGKSFTHYTEDQGLSYNDVRCILQDKNNHIWFGTNGGGISKYDGKQFHHYKSEDGLSDDDILCITADSDGNIWIGTDGNGVFKYNPSEKKGDTLFFQSYRKKNGLAGDIVWDILEDVVGNIWIATEDGGLCKFDGNSFVTYSVEQGLPGNEVITLFQDSKNNIWLGTEGNGASKITFSDLTSNSAPYTVTNYSKTEGLSENIIRSILEDKDGNVWFGTIGGGVTKFVQPTSKSDNGYFIHFTTKEGLTNAAISQILQDKAENIWFATYGGGISKYDGKLFTHFTTQEGLASSNVWSMVEDRNGDLWFGTGGAGISKYDGKSFSTYTTSEGLVMNDVRSMLCDSEGNSWFGTIGKGISKYTPAKKNQPATFTQYTTENGLSGNDIRSMIQDKEGNIWFATSEGGLTKFDGKVFMKFGKEQGLSSNDVRCVYQDSYQNIWLGTSGGGITKMTQNRNDESRPYNFTHFTKREGLSNDYILCVLEDKTKNLWFGTYGGGVARITQNDSKEKNSYSLLHLTEEQGLANNFVFSMVQDFSDNIWFGTRFGLSKFTPEKRTLFDQKIKEGKSSSQEIYFKNYVYEDGFLGIGCNGKAIFQSKNGIIWIGTNDRLTAYHPPQGGEKSDVFAPNIQLTGISLFNENISWVNLENRKDTSIILGNGVRVGDFEFNGVSDWYGVPEALSLAYDNNYLTFNFIGITMNQPKRVKYQYKLEGIDANWSAVTDRTEAPYGNIPNGTYTFKVKAMNSEGVWSNELHYTFTIRPPYWKTWWFRILVGSIIVLLLFTIYRWRTASLRNRQKQLEKTVADRTMEVVEQKQLIEEKHKEIKDSINYAERIQRSFLASQDLLQQNLEDYFVLFKPKDVVSGDFYWATKLHDGKFALVTADSTGHGVPGAIMSILNITCLEKAIDEKKLVDPAEILNHTRNSIIERLKKDGSSDGGKDGMDASVICFDLSKRTMIYAAANNPIWIVRNNEIIVCDPDSMPVAKHDKQNVPFNSKQVILEKGDLIYALTDGYPDQFGGSKGKKFMYKKLKELVLSISNYSMSEQKEKLDETFMEWKGNLEQVDDVCIVGVRV